MRDYFYPDDTIAENDLFFICALIERVARKQKIRNRDVVNRMGYEELWKKLSLACVLHCENPLAVTAAIIEEYDIPTGDFDVCAVNREICPNIPTALDMGKVYKRLILQTLEPGEDYAQGILRVYNCSICEKLEDYSCSAYYEPSYVIARAYYEDGFN